MIALNRVAMISSASSHEIRSNAPEPLAPVRRKGRSSRSGAVTRVS
jgi:hypothetical protein